MMAIETTWLVFVALGAVSGLLAGTFGIGGGLVVVPALVSVFALTGVDESIRMHLAIGTSLASIVLTSLTSVLAHHRRGAVLWRVVMALAPGVLVGGFLGAFVADALPYSGLKRVFALLVIGIAMYVMLNRQPEAHRPLPAKPGMFASGCIIGCLSALGGIGGGLLTGPFLLWCRIAIRNAVATAAAVTLPVATAGALGFLVIGLNATGLPGLASGYIFWPAVAGIAVSSVLFAPVGVRIAHAIPVGGLRRAFAILLASVGIYMLL